MPKKCKFQVIQADEVTDGGSAEASADVLAALATIENREQLWAYLRHYADARITVPDSLYVVFRDTDGKQYFLMVQIELRIYDNEREIFSPKDHIAEYPD